MLRIEAALLAAMTGIAGYMLGGARPTSAASPVRDAAKYLMERDRECDTVTSRDGSGGWVSYFAQDGILMPAGSELLVGQAAIRDHAVKAFAAPGFSLRWEPIDAGASGDLGYTYGLFRANEAGADGRPAVSYGKYVTIWRMQPDRSWRIAIHIANPSPPPAPAASSPAAPPTAEP
jgi:ketosteroid isomerase-like protein